ncbi:hypothetical protein [Rhodanobacter sp. OK091]|uniref:hypothetical protein n=1 Tax=Rhodanobacter sp. OK091 TaxID=1881037 RepID=UPI00116026B1|nr:hypothetical protein [Rhodanobacter sp. OK091]
MIKIYFNSVMAAFLFAALFQSVALASTPDLNNNSMELIKQIKATDYVFKATLGPCKNETVRRNDRDGLHYFTYSATCFIRPRPEQDCQAYRVTAEGTIDTPEQATLRNIQLKLLCSA